MKLRNRVTMLPKFLQFNILNGSTENGGGTNGGGTNGGGNDDDNPADTGD